MDVREKLVEQAISHFWYGVSHDIFSEPVTTYAKLAIEALKKENGATVQEWISVTERLPEKDGKYLAYEKAFHVDVFRVMGFTKNVRKIDKNDFAEEWQNVWYFYDSEYGYVTTNSITHWMPLPEPPKGE